MSLLLYFLTVQFILNMEAEYVILLLNIFIASILTQIKTLSSQRMWGLSDDPAPYQSSELTHFS